MTDKEQKIIVIMRSVPAGDGQEEQKIGSKYSLENRQNFAGVPEMTMERLENALKTIHDKSVAGAYEGKKQKPRDILRKGLATTITEMPPVLLDHVLLANDFPATATVDEILETASLREHLLKSLLSGRQIVDDIGKAPKCTGYIIAKPRSKQSADVKEVESEKPDEKDGDHKNMLYEDFQPFLPRQMEASEQNVIVTFEGYNKTVDEFFSSLEGQRLESRLTERESTAKRKLETARQDQAKRLESLQEAQLLNLRKAAAIEANIPRVQEAMDAVNGLISQGMDWVSIGRLIEREQQRENPVALIIKLPLKLEERTITLLLGEEEEEDADSGENVSDAGSEMSDTEDASRNKAPDKRLAIDINLDLTPWANAREYYDETRAVAAKKERTAQQATKALKSAEAKIAQDLKKSLKQEKPVLHLIRKPMWFEKFHWFVSSDGYIVLAGKDAEQNEMLYRRYLRKGDVYVHADMHGAASVVIKNKQSMPDAPIPPSTLTQAGTLSVCCSNAWNAKAGMGAWWVNADQVSKSAPTGEFLPTGSFMVRGKKNFLPPAQLVVGFAILFKISEDSVAQHVKHRLHEDAGDSTPDIGRRMLPANAEAGRQGDDSDKASDSGDDGKADDRDDDYDGPAERGNPLQPEPAASAAEDMTTDGVHDTIAELSIADEPVMSGALGLPADGGEEHEGEESEREDDSTAPPPSSSTATTPKPTGAAAAAATATPKKGPPKRGQRSKAKKIATKYRDQDEEDRAAIEALTGAAAARQRAQAEAAAAAERKAQQEAALQRRREIAAKKQQELAQLEEARRAHLEGDGGGAGDVEASLAEDKADHLLDALVGTPLPGDEILEAIPVCAPWAALARYKYKAKMQPGTTKKGRAVKEILEAWKVAALKKGAVDEQARDKERMWPREIELIKTLRPEEVVNCVFVGKVKVMMAGGSDGKGQGGGRGGGGGGSSKSGQGKGGKGGGKGSGGKK